MGTSATGIVLPGGKGSAIWFIGPGFFDSMQIPILPGGDVETRDQRGAPMVAIVHEEFARQRLGGRSPPGQHVNLPQECGKRAIEIVGVSRNARYGDRKRKMPPTVFPAIRTVHVESCRRGAL